MSELTVYPEYHDVIGNYKHDQLPYYISINTIERIAHLHHHDFAELSLIIEGYGSEIINGVRHEIKPGTVSFLLPHHIHEIHAVPAQSIIRAYCCMFDLNILFESSFRAELSALLLKAGQDYPSYAHLSAEDTSYLRGIFEQMTTEFRNSFPGKNCMILSRLVGALLIFYRAPKPVQTTPLRNEYKHVSNILRYLHLNYSSDISLEQVSDLFHISIAHICRMFKNEVGDSFLGYLHNLRVQSACNLLASTDMPIADIYIAVGFDSYRSFARVFKQLRGVTPSEFRDRAKLLS